MCTGSASTSRSRSTSSPGSTASGSRSLSDFDGAAIEAYDVVLEDVHCLSGVAERSVFVVEADGTVAYRWVRDCGNPDFDWLVGRVREAVEAL